MPTYNFKNEETGEVTEHFMKLSEMEQFKKDNPHMSQVLGASGLVRGTGDIKTANGFKEVLHKVAEAHPNSELAKKVGGRTAADVKTEKVTNKIFREREGRITKDNTW
jgi:hypothetical protein